MLGANRRDAGELLTGGWREQLGGEVGEHSEGVRHQRAIPLRAQTSVECVPTRRAVQARRAARKMPCAHGHQCKECGGSKKCEHGRQRSQCKECAGSGICEHGRRRSKCKECGGGGRVTFLEATEVDEFDGEEDPDEWVPTVQARLVAGPRGGGKRKR